MKLSHVALFSLAGMLLTSASVYLAVPAPGSAAAATAPVVAENLGPAAPPPADPSLTSFDAGTTLHVAGRVGHPRLAQGGRTFLHLEVRADATQQARSAAPSHLAIVIDRSGSMKGERLPNALAGAASAVDHLGDGDMVSVISFDTRTSLVVDGTVLSQSNREAVKAAIRSITLGGDTCISCGIEEGIFALQRSTDKVDRMILLSDGDATAGVRDVAGLQRIAERARRDAMTITTIGVGVSYNQQILGAVALQGGGGHFFIENASSLEPVFRAEADKLRTTVATGAVATIDLGEGVEVERVFDRTFERRGRSIVVPLGNFTAGDTRTILMEVRTPAAPDGPLPLADISLDYRDLVQGEASRCAGRLGVVVTSDPATASPLDGLVNARLQRSETAATLLEANALFAQGKGEEAARHIARRRHALAKAADEARAAAPTSKTDALDKDFTAQSESLANAQSGLGGRKPSPKAPVVVRQNQEAANPFME